MEAKRILIVEDDLEVRTYLEALLEDHGFEVNAAGNVDEARRILRKKPPDLICMDIMMPGKSGIAFYQELKLDESFSKIPAIFISAFSMARDFTGNGFRKLIADERIPEPTAYIEKPVNVDVLLGAIEKALSAQSLTSQ